MDFEDDCGFATDEAKDILGRLMMGSWRMVWALVLGGFLSGCQVLEVVLGPPVGVIESRPIMGPELPRPLSAREIGEPLPEASPAAPMVSQAAPPPEVSPSAPAERTREERAEASPFAFKGEKPVRLSMPVPVFPEGVVFDPLIPGWVEFEVAIDQEGSVVEAVLTGRSNEALVRPAREALLQAKYTPVVDFNGYPVQVSFRERVEF